MEGHPRLPKHAGETFPNVAGEMCFLYRSGTFPSIPLNSLLVHSHCWCETKEEHETCYNYRTHFIALSLQYIAPIHLLVLAQNMDNISVIRLAIQSIT